MPERPGPCAARGGLGPPQPSSSSNDDLFRVLASIHNPLNLTLAARQWAPPTRESVLVPLPLSGRDILHETVTRLGIDTETGRGFSRHIASPAFAGNHIQARFGAKAQSLHSLRESLYIHSPEVLYLSRELVAATMAAPELFSYLADLLDDGLKTFSLVRTPFGDEDYPQIVSVRASPHTGMPGQLMTVLNIGLNDAACEFLARRFQDPIGARMLYLRHIAQFARDVDGITPDHFADLQDYSEAFHRSDLDTRLADINRRIADAQSRYASHTGQPFPQDPWMQMIKALNAVAASWHTPDADAYRRHFGIEDYPPHGIVIQRMVFGSLGTDGRSAAGVLHTRHRRLRHTGVDGRFVVKGSGDEVMSEAGPRVYPIRRMGIQMPDLLHELTMAALGLERQHGDAQEVEFVVERGRLWVLQNKPMPRTDVRALEIATDLFYGGVNTLDQAVNSIAPSRLHRLRAPRLSRRDLSPSDYLITGESVMPGAVRAPVRIGYETAATQLSTDEPYILVADHFDRRAMDIILGAAGCIFFDDLSAHAVHTMVDAGIPTLNGVRKTNAEARFEAGGLFICDDASACQVLKTGVPLTLDTSREDGFATLRELPTIPSSFLDLLRSEPPTDDPGRPIGTKAHYDGKSRRRGTRFKIIQEWVALQEEHRESAGQPSPRLQGNVIERLLTEDHAREGLSVRERGQPIRIRDVMKTLGLVRESWNQADGTETYEFSEGAAEFLRRLWEEDPKRLKTFSYAILATTRGGHSLATGLANTFPDDLKVALLNNVVTLAREDGLPPGVKDGVWVLFRIFSFLSRHESGIDMLNRLHTETLLFIVEEMKDYYVPTKAGEMGEAREVLSRYPLMAENTMAPFLTRLEEEKKRALLERCRSTSPDVADWLESFLTI